MTDTLYRWVKASERSPIEGDLYHVQIRLIESGLETFPGTCNWYNGWQANDDYEVVEWLEPYTVPSQESESLKQAAEAEAQRRYPEEINVENQPHVTNGRINEYFRKAISPEHPRLIEKGEG